MGDSLTALSVFVAIFFGFLGLWWNIKSHKRMHTINLISNFSTNPDLSESDFQVCTLTSNNVEIDGANIAPDLDRHIMRVLDYYEFLAVSYFDGALDKETFIDLRGNAMKRSYELARTYISDRRAKYGDEIYFHFEKMIMSQEDK